MSRTWELGSSSGTMPLDLVREQDFILRVRRLQRLGTSHLVVNLVLSAIVSLAKNRPALETIRTHLQELAQVTNGVFAEMSNGDVFFIWEENAAAAKLPQQLVDVLPIAGNERGSTDSFLLTYHMPADYTRLRERTNHYIEIVHVASTMPPEAPADILKSESARGPLTAWSVDQIGKLLDEIDVRPYARTQPIYRIDSQENWQPVSEEYFISFEDFRRERFPKLDLITPEHLFFSLCEMMDQRLLSLFTDAPATIIGRPLHLNLSVSTVIGSIFARFTRSVPRDKRGLMTFELHRGDLFQDFARTLNAIELLHREGFKVAIDSVTPDMLPYLNLTSFTIDFLKINVSGDRIELLDDAAVRKGMLQLPTDKMIFFRCDSDKAMMAGRDLGVRLFQGWHIDDIAKTKKKT